MENFKVKILIIILILLMMVPLITLKAYAPTLKRESSGDTTWFYYYYDDGSGSHVVSKGFAVAIEYYTDVPQGDDWLWKVSLAVRLEDEWTRTTPSGETYYYKPYVGSMWVKIDGGEHCVFSSHVEYIETNLGSGDEGTFEYRELLEMLLDILGVIEMLLKYYPSPVSLTIGSGGHWIQFTMNDHSVTAASKMFTAFDYEGQYVVTITAEASIYLETNDPGWLDSISPSGRSSEIIQPLTLRNIYIGTYQISFQIIVNVIPP